MTKGDCEKYGIEIIQLTIEEYYGAAQKRGALSFQDWGCLLVAQRMKAFCLTNDKPLRKECHRKVIQTVRGLIPLLDLVERKRLRPEIAWQTTLKIQSCNH